MEKWYKNCYRRHLLDMHIEDWDDSFLSRFDPGEYVQNLKRAKIQSPMIYLHSHIGLCNFPTKTGKTHRAFKGNDKLKELLKKCKAEGMKTVGYYSLIFNNVERIAHPEWSIVDQNGKTFIDCGQRYGLCCPNNEQYRAFTVAQIEEMAEYFEGCLDGIFFDMPYWEQTCHCEACQKKWQDEFGGSLPIKEDWQDKAWKNYIKKRQEWMGEFVAFVREQTNRAMPGVTVEFNFAAVVGCNWLAGSTEVINEYSEFTGGDLYGDLYDHSFTCKYYMGITKNPPFEYMTCRCDKRLHEHTITKTQSALENEIMLTCAHHGASLVIDAIDPIGTMDKRVYQRIGKVFEKQIPHEKYFEGEYVADVAVFFDSTTQFSSNGYDFYNKTCCINIVRTLAENHVTTAVIANGNMENLEKYKMIFAPALEDFDNKNVLKLINYVQNGGILYLSSSSDKRLMQEFFGAVYRGTTVETKTYISGFDGFDREYPLPLNYALPVFDVKDKSLIKGYVTLPYTDPKDNIKFASIHSNPPGRGTDIPAILEANFGKGKVFWTAAAIEYDRRIAFKEIFMDILKRFVPKESLTVTANTSKNVEITAFKTEKGYTVHLTDLLAQQEQLTHSCEIIINGKTAARLEFKLFETCTLPFVN